MVFFSTDTCSYSVFTASLLQQGLRSKASPQITWMPQILSSPGSHVVCPDSALALCRVLYKSCFTPRPGKAPGSWEARRRTGMLVRSVQALECSPAPLSCLSMLSPHCKANFVNTTSLLFTGWWSWKQSGSTQNIKGLGSVHGALTLFKFPEASQRLLRGCR